MKCPYCSSKLSSVLDKREVKGSGEIRRRRECGKCKKRFTTYERVTAQEFYVLKRDGRREIYDRSKLRLGLEKALEKRPAFEKIDLLVEKIECKLRAKSDRQVDSRFIGKIILSELKKIDIVAYLRFVSVYRQFNVVSDFTKELQHLKI